MKDLPKKEIKGLKNKIDRGAELNKRMKEDEKELKLLKAFLKEKAKKKKVKLLMGRTGIVSFTNGTDTSVEFSTLWSKVIGDIMESLCDDLELTTQKNKIEDMTNLIHKYNGIIRNKIGGLVKADITAIRKEKLEVVIDEEDVPYKSVSFKIQ